MVICVPANKWSYKFININKWKNNGQYYLAIIGYISQLLLLPNILIGNIIEGLCIFNWIIFDFIFLWTYTATPTT